jgi:hypothetical protein
MSAWGTGLPSGVLTDVAQHVLAGWDDYSRGTKKLMKLAHVSRAWYVVIMRTEELWSCERAKDSFQTSRRTYLVALIKGHLLLGADLPLVFHERFSPLVGWSCVSASVSETTDAALWAPTLKKRLHQCRDMTYSSVRDTVELETCVGCSMRTCKCLLTLCPAHRGAICLTCSSGTLLVEQGALRKFYCQPCGGLLCLQHDGVCCDMALVNGNENMCQNCSAKKRGHVLLETSSCVCGSATICEMHALGSCEDCGLVGKCPRCPDVQIHHCGDWNCDTSVCTQCDPRGRMLTKCDGCEEEFCTHGSCYSRSDGRDHDDSCTLFDNSE